MLAFSRHTQEENVPITDQGDVISEMILSYLGELVVDNFSILLFFVCEYET